MGSSLFDVVLKSPYEMGGIIRSCTQSTDADISGLLKKLSTTNSVEYVFTVSRHTQGQLGDFVL